MSVWTEDEFQRVAVASKMSKRTLDACQRVLVGGEDGKGVATELGIFPQQISRAVNTLIERHEEQVASINKMRESVESLKEYAVEQARLLVRGDWAVKDAVPGERYEGQVIMRTPGFVVQKVVRDLVVHDLGRLQDVPDMTKPMAIDYPADGERASVEPVPRRMNERAIDKSVGRGGR